MSYPESCNYNPIGQLIENKAEQIQYFYNASGLVTEVWYEGSPKVKFMYNDRNHRVKKESYHNGSLLNSTYYVRDVAGQVMAIYTEDSSPPQLTEQPIYGAGRIGIQYTHGLAVYELTDHLGNVRALFTKESATDSELEGYTDYYPFGMAMRRMRDADQYRYAFQGQYSEKDDETGLNSFELRMYDSRIGRWISPDPYGEFNSPYLGMGNNPVKYVDPDGGCIKNDEHCIASRIGERVVGDDGAVWEWDGESWGKHWTYAYQLDGYTGTPNGDYTYKDWQYDNHGVAQAKMLQNQMAMGNAAIDPSMPKKVIMGTFAVPLTIITMGEFIGVASSIGTSSTSSFAYSSYGTVAAESTEVLSYQLFRVPAGQIINHFGKRYIGGQFLPMSFSETLFYGKGISEVYLTSSYVGSLSSAVYHGSNLYRLGALTGGTGFVLYDLFNPEGQDGKRPYDPSNFFK